jgi:hypothetical protein
LPAALLEQSPFAPPIEQRIQKPLLGWARDQARAELAEDGVIESGVGPFQTERLLPVHAAPHRLRRLPIRETLDKRPQRC